MTASKRARVRRNALRGVFAVFAVALIGMGMGFATGFNAPQKAYAQLAGTLLAPVTVMPAPVLPAPPAPPIPLTPLVTPPPPTPTPSAPAKTVDQLTVTAPSNNTNQTPTTPPAAATTVTTPPVSELVVTAPSSHDKDTNTPPCCTTPTVPSVSPLIVPGATTPDTDTNTPPCCNVAVTTPPTLPVSPPITPPVTTPVIPPVIPVTPTPPVVPPSTPVPQCISLTASATTIQPGEAVTLSWQTQNATSISINNGVGVVTPVASGSVVVHPAGDTTYTATVNGAGGQATCSVPVRVTTPGGTTPSCVSLSASETTFNVGDVITLHYVTSNATSASIAPGVGSVTPVAAGSVTVQPTTATTYTLTVPGAPANNSCQVSVVPNTPNATTTPPNGTSTPPNGGGGGCTTNCGGGGGCISGCGGGGGGGGGVLLGVTPQPLANVYLSQIPYTGLDLGPWGTILYWLTLLIWSGAAAYLVLFGALPFAARKAQAFGLTVKTVLDSAPARTSTNGSSAPVAAAVPAAVTSIAARAQEKQEESARKPELLAEPAPAAEPMPAGGTPATPSIQMSAAAAPSPAAHAPVAPATRAVRPAPRHEGFRAFASSKGALTIDDIVKGLSRESGMVFEPSPASDAPVLAAAGVAASASAAAIDSVEDAARPTPSEPLLPDVPSAVQPAPAASVAAQPAPVSVPVTAPTSAVPAPQPAPAYGDEVPTFISALLAGDRDAVFGTLRNVARSGADTQDFLSQVVCALDDAYRAHIDGTPVHPEIARITDGCAPSFLERVVAALATAVDSSYSSGVTGTKLALTRALAVVHG